MPFCDISGGLRLSTAYPQKWIILGYAHFDDLSMIAPVANALEPAKPHFSSFDGSLAALRGADDDRTLTGSHDRVESGEFVQKAYPVNGSGVNPGRLQ